MPTPLPPLPNSLVSCSLPSYNYYKRRAGMLMAATHMMDSSAASPPPWLPVLADHHHQLLHDFTASAPAPPPSRHQFLARAAPAAAHRRVAKRRPRPSRRLPTTYINADPASFRRMVHQVTGATHDLLPQPQQPTTELLLNRPSPIRAGSTTGPGAMNTLLLPTLDTSAFLVGAAGVLPRKGTDTPSDGSGCTAAGLPVPRLAAEADNNSASNSSSSGLLVFPTLESWDPATLF